MYHIVKQAAVFLGIDYVHTAAQNAHHGISRAERSLHGHGVDAPRHAGNHDGAALSQLVADALGRAQAVGAGVSRPHYGHGRPSVKIRQPAPVVEQCRRVVNGTQSRRIGAVLIGQDVNVLAVAQL